MSLQPPNPNGANNAVRAERVNVWSCVNCRRRKVRCDRRHPCAHCIRNKAECVFPVSGRIPRRDRDANYPNLPGQKQAELLGRLRRLEAMVGDLGSQVEQAAPVSRDDRPVESSRSATSATAVAASERGWPESRLALQNESAIRNLDASRDGEQTQFGMAEGTLDPPRVFDEFGQLVVANDGDIIVGNRFWTIFCKEVEHIFEAIHGPGVPHFDRDSGSLTTSTSGSRSHNGYYSFLLGNTSVTYQQEDLHPLPSQMLFLWQIYMDNVDPFMKVLHVPTMTKIIREVRGNFHALGFSMRALLLVISLAATMTLADDEVRVNFSTGKEQLVIRYRLGTERALEQADLLNDPDIIAFQALTIYLGVLQHTGETRTAWVLAGVLIRLTVSMKFHRDGSHFADLTSFEIEMRRRIWWQICFTDSRSEDVQGFEYKLSEGMFDTEIPANTDDIDLVPGNSMPPIAVERWTDMTVFLIHCDIWKLSRRLQSIKVALDTSPPDIEERFELLHQIRSRIENTYLVHLDPIESLHSFVATSTRLFLTKVDLILYTKQQSGRVTELWPADNSQRDRLFTSSLSIIEYTYSLQNESSWSGWSWQIQGKQPPWHALRVVLGQLCTCRWGSNYERPWFLAKRSLDSLPEAARTDPRHQQLLVLVSAVQRNRADELHQKTSGASTNADADLTYAAAPTLSAPFAQNGIGETSSTWTSHEPLLFMAEDSSHGAFSDDLGLEMDWEAWDEIAEGIQPSFEFWDMTGL